MKVVKVYGPLRKYLGQCRFEFVADTPAQAMKALCVNFPGLAQWLLDREAEGMAFRVTRGRDKITNEAPEGLVLPWSEREVFSIAPVIVGAGRGVGKILAGIALVALAFVTYGGSLALGATGLTVKAGLTGFAAFGAGAAAAAGTLGIGLIVTGVAQLISPTPSLGLNTQAKKRHDLSHSRSAELSIPVKARHGSTYLLWPCICWRCCNL
jgi:predicted phage tail protein